MEKFSVRDTMLNVLKGRGAGSAGLFVDTPPTPATPITPVAAVAAFSPRLEALDEIVRARQIDAAQLDHVALEIGRAVVGARAVALCTQDMPTCSNDPWGNISRVADSYRDVLRQSDFAVMRDAVAEADRAMAHAEKAMRSDHLPRLREELRSALDESGD